MLKWSAFPFVRVSVSLILGIVIFEAFPALWQNVTAVLIAATIMYLLSWIFLRRNFVHGLVSFLFIAYTGGALTLLSTPASSPAHYTHHPNVDGMIGTIISDATERERHYRYDFEIHQVKEDSVFQVVEGKIYLYIEKGQTPFAYGDVLAITRGYFAISPPKNPHEFDYREYLQKQHVLAHAFAKSHEVSIIDHRPPNPLRTWAYAIRSSAQNIIDRCIETDRERAILSALLLGIKDQLDSEIRSSYASAGAMHILAVSGLHVGIIYYLVLLFLRPFKEKRWGVVPFAAIAISIIWMYALVTGFSPSVIRATIMFSVIILSEAFSKRANIYNSLGIAAFLMIIIEPYVIYSAGFQLSFTAVFGIVIIYPRLYRLLEAHTKAGDYLWSITCVSVAAQLATFPLSVHYFHQFPTYFLISNLLVMPVATLMLGGGLLMLLAGGLFSAAGALIGQALQWLIWGLNEAITFLQILPYPVFDWLYLDTVQVVLVYGILCLSVYGMAKYRFSSLVLASLLMLVFSSWSSWKELKNHSQQKIVFYEADNLVAIDFIDGKNSMLLVDPPDADLGEVLDFRVNPHHLACGLRKAQETLISSSDLPFGKSTPNYDLVVWKGRRILIVKELPDVLENPLHADVVYLKNLPEDHSLGKFKGKKCILGMNLNFYKARDILIRAEKEGLNIHSLDRDGYWELDLNNTKL